MKRESAYEVEERCATLSGISVFRESTLVKVGGFIVPTEYFALLYQLTMSFFTKLEDDSDSESSGSESEESLASGDEGPQRNGSMFLRGSGDDSESEDESEEESDEDELSDAEGVKPVSHART